MRCNRGPLPCAALSPTQVFYFAKIELLGTLPCRRERERLHQPRRVALFAQGVGPCSCVKPAARWERRRKRREGVVCPAGHPHARRRPGPDRWTLYSISCNRAGYPRSWFGARRRIYFSPGPIGCSTKSVPLVSYRIFPAIHHGANAIYRPPRCSALRGCALRRGFSRP